MPNPTFGQNCTSSKNHRDLGGIFAEIAMLIHPCACCFSSRMNSSCLPEGHVTDPRVLCGTSTPQQGISAIDPSGCGMSR